MIRRGSRDFRGNRERLVLSDLRAFAEDSEAYSMILMTKKTPNKSPEPTAVGAGRSAVAVHAANRCWFSFFSLGIVRTP
jgi:hypothetical protein